MTVYEFIFTSKQPHKYLRHLAFWVTYACFWFFWISAFFVDFKKWLAFNWEVHLQYTILIEATYTYLVVYFLLPRFFAPKKYIQFGSLFFVCTLGCYILYVLNRFRLTGLANEPGDKQLLMGWYFSMNFIINGPPVALALFLTFKMLKTWYIKIEEKSILIEENARAELQLLKAQVHPHFLFNTLNNIYSFALTQSPNAGSLVLKLSDTLRYMIDDCEADLVPLEKEIQLIKNYLGLENVRYGNRLHLQVDINGDYENKMIAPLLMIPFIENSFKHGASMMRGQQWIKLNLSIQDKWLYFIISNSKPLQPVSQNGKEGIGISNVQKRLQLLYPGRHQLTIESGDAIYIVHLQVELRERVMVPETNQLIAQTQTITYVR